MPDADEAELDEVNRKPSSNNDLKQPTPRRSINSVVMVQGLMGDAFLNAGWNSERHAAADDTLGTLGEMTTVDTGSDNAPESAAQTPLASNLGERRNRPVQLHQNHFAPESPPAFDSDLVERFLADCHFEKRAAEILEDAARQLAQEHKAAMASSVNRAISATLTKCQRDCASARAAAAGDPATARRVWEADPLQRWAEITDRLYLKSSVEDWKMLKNIKGCLREDAKRPSDRLVDPEQGFNLSELLQRTGSHSRRNTTMWLRYLVQRPMSKKRLTWDCLGALSILYEVIVFPLQVFNPPFDDLNYFTHRFMSVFWACDMCSQFLLGYSDDAGFMEMRPEYTATRYLRTWFAFDLILVVLDWAMLIFSHYSEAVNMLRFRRFLRLIPILRCIRLFRIGKYTQFFQNLKDVFANEWLLMVIKIMKLLMSLVLVNHYICCGWFFLGTQFTPKGEPSWVDFYDLENTPFLWQYFTSLQWSLAQFTPSASEVQPKNTSERGFALLVVLFGMASSSSFVSNITSTITQLRQYNAVHNQQEHNLRKFLQSHQVSYDLTTRIWTFIRQSTAVRTNRMREAETLLLNELPTRLLVEAHAEVFAPVITKHALFRNMADASMQTLYSICHNAMKHSTVVANLELFIRGAECKAMIFNVQGKFKYLLGHLPRMKDEDFLSNEPKRKNSSWRSNTTFNISEIMEKEEAPLPAPAAKHKELAEGQWACEACLWTRWFHVGSLIAATHSDVFQLSSSSLSSLVAHLPGIISYKESWLRMYNRHVTLGINVHDLSTDMESLEERASEAFPVAGEGKLRKNPLAAL